MIRPLLLILTLALAPVGALAQDDPAAPLAEPPATDLIGPPVADEAASPIEGVDYAAWERTAQRSAAISESGTGSIFALERMRNDLVNWRDEFHEAQGKNAARIETVRQQIAALGGSADTSQTEDPVIAARRNVLQAELGRLRAPVLLAQEAYAEANGLIAEIDSLLRARRAGALTTRGLSPLNPFHWPDIASDLVKLSVSIVNEARVTFTSAARQQVLKKNLAQVVLSALAGLLLLVRGWHWSRRLAAWGKAREWRGAELWGLLMSLGQVVLPLLGLGLLVTAVQLSGLAGFRLSQVIGAIPAAGAYVIMAWWLAEQLFTDDGRQHIAVDIGYDQCARARALVIALGGFSTIAAMLQALLTADEIATVSMTAALLPVQILISIVLFRLGRTFASASGREPEATEGAGGADVPESATFRRGIIVFIGRVLVAAAVAGPVLMALGWGITGDALIDPLVRTLGLIGAVMVLQSFANEVHRVITRSDEGTGDALMPVLAMVVLTLAAIPIVILIWGGRAEDLAELWARFREGFAFGDTRISPTDFLAFVVIFMLGYVVTRLLQGLLRTTILPRTRMDAGGRTAVISGVGYVGIVIAALIAITSVGLDLSSLAIVAGALSVGIGFGLQTIVSNFISGIILLIERPISVGDWIEVGGQMGYVREISVRSTRVETFDRTDVIIPNADLVAGQVINWTRGSLVGRLLLPVNVVYGTDSAKVLKILSEIAEAHPMVVLNPPPAVILLEIGSDLLTFQIRAILRDVNFILSVQSEMNIEIARRFYEEGIEIAGLARANTTPGRTAATAAAMQAAGYSELQQAHVALMESEGADEE